MKIIFLDIDGVLNCAYSKSHCFGCLGIDDDKVKRLKEVVDKTGAKIYLVSDWKGGWYKEPYMKGEQDIFANYLDKKLKKQGLYIADKVGECSCERGKDIKGWLNGKDVQSFVILDDIEFDYRAENLADNYIQTNSTFGLTDEDVLKAIEILGEKQ